MNFPSSGLIVKQHSGSAFGGTGTVTNSLFPGRSGSQRALANLFSGLTPKSILLGQKIGLAKLSGLSGQTIVGGEFTGTYYRNSFFPPTFAPGYFSSFQNGGYVFAFGNIPLNNPSAFLSFFTIAAQQQRSFLELSNGSILSITNGQILFPQISPGGLFNGAVFTIGLNPFNTHLFGSGPLTNLSSYLFF
jgi:hypothetical protein